MFPRNCVAIKNVLTLGMKFFKLAFSLNILNLPVSLHVC